VSVWIPDALWEQFHPVSLIETWVVEFRGENEWDRTERLERESEQRERRREQARAQRKIDEQAAAERQRGVDVRALDGRAAGWTWFHLLFTLVAVAWPWCVRAGVGAGSWPHVLVVGLIVGTLVVQVIALGVSGQVIHRAADRGDHTFLLWFEMAFVWMMPGIGHFLGFGRVFDLLWGDNRRKLGPCTRWGGYNWLIISLGGLALGTSAMLAYLL
jgi:hypothetical protein